MLSQYSNNDIINKIKYMLQTIYYNKQYNMLLPGRGKFRMGGIRRAVPIQFFLKIQIKPIYLNISSY